MVNCQDVAVCFVELADKCMTSDGRRSCDANGGRISNTVKKISVVVKCSFF